ncbi:MAG: DUF4924 family protein [Reichenbachiella sp.]
MNKNITEYIIEMYRKEDMLRAYNLDLEKFGTQVINFFPIDNKEKFLQVNYYEELIFKMQEQGIEKTGHLKELNELVKSLSTLHKNLKKEDNNYLEVYNKVEPFINENIKHAKGKVKDEIQICLNGVYGYLLLKIEERPIKPEEQSMVNAFGDLLSLLSFKYEHQKRLN